MKQLLPVLQRISNLLCRISHTLCKVPKIDVSFSMDRIDFAFRIDFNLNLRFATCKSKRDHNSIGRNIPCNIH
jgi:hypothetical protein